MVAYALWLLTAAIDGHAGHPQTRPWWHPLTGLLWANGSRLYVLPALWFCPRYLSRRWLTLRCVRD